MTPRPRRRSPWRTFVETPASERPDCRNVTEVAPRGAGLIVPAYFHPAVAGGDWARLVRLAPLLRAVVLNVHNGPGPTREPALAEVATRVYEAGVPVLGYVDTAYGRRPPAELRRDLAGYRRWYPTSGVFLDRAAAGAGQLPWYKWAAREAREYGAGTVVFNHGAHPDPGYAFLADALVTFEGPETAHRALDVPAWVREYPVERFWHLVYATGPDQVAGALRRAVRGHVGAIAVTDRSGANPWDGLPRYLSVPTAAPG